MSKIFLVLFSFLMMSCTTTSSQTTNNKQMSSTIITTESQGGTGDNSFKVLATQEDLTKAIKDRNHLNNIISDTPNGDDRVAFPKFPAGKKAVLLNLGSFRSGDHTIQQIKSVSVTNNTLIVEVPQRDNAGGMEIQVLSKPWVIFTIPTDFKFSAVQLKYTK